METSDTSVVEHINVNVVDVKNGCYILQGNNGVEYKLPVGMVPVENGQLLQIAENQYLQMNLPDNNDENAESENVEPSSETSVSETGNLEIAEWTDSGTKFLLELYEEKKKLVEKRKIKSLKQMWIIISCKMNEQGHLYTAQQCENKWKSLERSFKKTLENKKKTGRGRKNCPYERELANILMERASVVPPLVLSATSAQTRNILQEQSLNVSETESHADFPPPTNIETNSPTVTPRRNTLSKEAKPGRSATALELSKLRKSIEQRSSEKKLDADRKYEQRERLIKQLDRKNTLLEHLINLQENGNKTVK